MKKVMFIGISGGTSSGKTTTALYLKEYLSKQVLVDIIQQDSYYIDRGNIPLKERESINYDHPDAIEIELLLEHLHHLKKRRPVDIPRYDFSTHTRQKDFTHIQPKDIIIVEGTLIFTNPLLVDIFDYKIFIDTADDIRFIRRLIRDIEERGRSLDSIITQYLKTVRPMHIKFVEMSKKIADIVITGNCLDQKKIKEVASIIIYKFKKQ